MSVLLQIVRINDIIVPIIAILSNIILLCLIKTVKTKTLIHIKYSLIPNSILDIVLSTVTFFVAPHLFHVDGIFYIIIGDFIGLTNYNIACHMVAAFSAITAINMLSTTVSFYIRYLIICRNCTLSIRAMVLPYFILFTIFVTFYILSLWFSISADGNFETSILTTLWKTEYNKSPLYVANKILAPQFLSICGFLFFCSSVAYGLIFYFSIQISKTLKTHIDSNNSGTKMLHKQIQRTLFFQVIGPAFIGCFPVLLLFTDSFFALSPTNSSLILSLCFPWASLCNPIAALIFIKPYQNYIKTINVLKPFKRFSTTNILFTSPPQITFIQQ